MTKGPGKVTPGDGIYGLLGVPLTALGRSADESPNLSPPLAGSADCRLGTNRVMRAAAWRKWSHAMTGEALRRPTVGKPNL